MPVIGRKLGSKDLAQNHTILKTFAVEKKLAIEDFAHVSNRTKTTLYKGGRSANSLFHATYSKETACNTKEFGPLSVCFSIEIYCTMLCKRGINAFGKSTCIYPCKPASWAETFLCVK